MAKSSAGRFSWAPACCSVPTTTADDVIVRAVRRADTDEPPPVFVLSKDDASSPTSPACDRGVGLSFSAGDVVIWATERARLEERGGSAREAAGLPTLLPSQDAGARKAVLLPDAPAPAGPAQEKRVAFDYDLPSATPLASPHPSPHARDVVRRLSRRITTRLKRRRTTLFTSSRRVPSPKVPGTAAPLLAQRIPDVTIEGVRAALRRTERCPLLRFLREVLGCYGMEATGWQACHEIPGTSVRKSFYSLPVPRDIPEVMARLLRIPETISSTSVWRLHDGGAEGITVVQHSYTKDILYGDRFRMESTLSFREDPGGGIMIKQWAEVIWLSPLPWTHGVVRHIVEKRARAEVIGASGDLVRIIEEEAKSPEAESADCTDDPAEGERNAACT